MTAAEECDLRLTDEQLSCLSNAVENWHENYSMAFYSPPSSERMNQIENDWKTKLEALQSELDSYRKNAESAVKKALRIHQDDHVSIQPHGKVSIL